MSIAFELGRERNPFFESSNYYILDIGKNADETKLCFDADALSAQMNARLDEATAEMHDAWRIAAMVGSN